MQKIEKNISFKENCMRKTHLDWIDIIKIHEGGKIPPEKEKHFFRCIQCQKKLEVLRLWEEDIIEKIRNKKIRNIEGAILIDPSYLCNLIKGEYIQGYEVRGNIGFNKMRTKKEYSHSIKTKNLFVDIQKIKDFIEIKELNDKKFTVLIYDLSSKALHKIKRNITHTKFKWNFKEILIVITT